MRMGPVDAGFWNGSEGSSLFDLGGTLFRSVHSLGELGCALLCIRRRTGAGHSPQTTMYFSYYLGDSTRLAFSNLYAFFICGLTFEAWDGGG